MFDTLTRLINPHGFSVSSFQIVTFVLVVALACFFMGLWFVVFCLTCTVILLWLSLRKLQRSVDEYRRSFPQWDIAPFSFKTDWFEKGPNDGR